jgi:hypothetical protein
MIADLKRREVRKQHSRMRPSKKRREYDKRVRGDELIRDECDSVCTTGCESSHSVGSGATSPIISNQSLNIPEMQHIVSLLELIRKAVETDGSHDEAVMPIPQV